MVQPPAAVVPSNCLLILKCTGLYGQLVDGVHEQNTFSATPKVAFGHS